MFKFHGIYLAFDQMISILVFSSSSRIDPNFQARKYKTLGTVDNGVIGDVRLCPFGGWNAVSRNSEPDVIYNVILVRELRFITIFVDSSLLIFVTCS